MNGPTRPMAREQARTIASAFAPAQRFGNRWDYFYSRSKLGSDPLYPGVCDALRADGNSLAYRGVDNDAGKIAQARRGGANAGLRDATFDCVDLAQGPPAHRGSVAILDVLQFVPPETQDTIIDRVIAMLEPGALMVIRTGLDDGSARARTTRRIDSLSRALGWMNAGPKRYPNADALRARFDAAGLASEFTPLYAGTPFNNWRVVASYPGNPQR